MVGYQIIIFYSFFHLTCYKMLLFQSFTDFWQIIYEALSTHI